MTILTARRFSTLRQVAAVALASMLLSGCIIVPEHHYRAYPVYYYR